MAPRNIDTKQEILRIGMDLIKRYGYNAFSYADISKALDMKNAAVHYHFRGKEDLLTGILDQYLNDYVLMGKQLQGSGFTALQKLEKFIERYSVLTEMECICIIGSVASDFNTLPESVKVKIKELVSLVLQMVEKTLQEGKKRGEFHFTESAKTQALLIMTNLAAGVQLSRITGKSDYELIRKALVRQVKG
ncbi:MAG: TetR/AcrR family transcriptional regulator [Chitinophagaceae bacterium]|nr:MAG: TetR/AcrR family transcriptional regulator [Chitinophagaceae bacterium]